jgi:mannose-6-phosphate isomerase
MDSVNRALYPLRFEPMLQYRPWGGRRLAALLGEALPGDDPIGEAWLLSDRENHSSRIVNGSLEGQTIGRIMQQWPEQLLGKRAGHLHRFPLLLKFLDVRGDLSVQVHPSDAQAAHLPGADSGKTEAWVVIAAGPKARVYAGLKPPTSADPPTSAQTLREAIARGEVADHLAFFTPKPGDGIFIPAGTVHALKDVLVFEVQENSDVTLRLYDWNHIDAKTHQRRPLQVEQALACIDFTQGVVVPVVPVEQEAKSVLRERLFDDPHFRVWRVRAETSFLVGTPAAARILVCLDGAGHVTCDGADHALAKGEVMLLPAECGALPCEPHAFISLLEISLPEDG